LPRALWGLASLGRFFGPAPGRTRSFADEKRWTTPCAVAVEVAEEGAVAGALTGEGEIAGEVSVGCRVNLAIVFTKAVKYLQ
jgi:hypothetical protein